MKRIYSIFLLLLLSGQFLACDFCWISDCGDPEIAVDCLVNGEDLANLLEAYNSKEAEYLKCCFASDYLFHFNPRDSIDVAKTFPDLTISREREIGITKHLFSIADSVSLVLWGTASYPYNGPTGESLMRLPRQFDLRIIFKDHSGYAISGDCEFIVRDESGEVKIVDWYDYSGHNPSLNKSLLEIDEDKSWGFLKWYFR